MSPTLAQDADADALLDRDPSALLTGMLLDQHVSRGTVRPLVLLVG
ncbi:hypothetical protein [Pseudonocardia sp.]